MKCVRQFPAFFGLAVCVLAGGCTVGPAYQRPTAPVPAKWDVSEPWRESAPKDGVAKGEWWAVFHDDDLSSLEKQALDANQTIKVSVAQLEQARASAAVQIATQFPNLSVAPQAERERLSGSRPPSSTFPVTSAVTQNSYTLPFTAGYEVDLFGRRRRSIEAAQASYQASAADLENVRLVIAAELAGDYFTLRQLDTELGILNRTVQTLQRGLQLVDSRHKGGVASGLDVAQRSSFCSNENSSKTPSPC
jgi:outer membrane protein, multidrug efflux system